MAVIYNPDSIDAIKGCRGCQRVKGYNWPQKCRMRKAKTAAALCKAARLAEQR